MADDQKADGQVNCRYSPACERNREPILRVLERYLPRHGRVLEIGAGTGQHAVYFAGHLTGLSWIASDLKANHKSIRAWIDAAGLPNLKGPKLLDVTKTPWPVTDLDACFSANTTHIMHWPAVESLFAGLGKVLKAEGVFCLYGPFSYDGAHTAASNQRFDQQLRAEDPGMGIRDIDQIIALATAASMTLLDDVAMPANNRTLVFSSDKAPCYHA